MRNKKGIIHMLPLLAITSIIAVSILIMSASKKSSIGNVLKDSDENTEVDNSGSGSSNSGSDDSDKEDDSAEPEETQELEDHDEDSTSEFQTEVHDDGSVETQFESEDGSGNRIKLHTSEEEVKIELTNSRRVRVRTKDGEERIDIYQGGVKVRFEFKDGKFIAKAEYDGQEEGVDIDQEDVAKMVEELGNDDIKISTASGRLSLARGNANAVTDFPLSLNLDTNSLVVTTPAGERTVVVLPDQAIANLIAANTISRSSSGDIELTDLDGEPIYEILGVSEQRLLGLIPVEIEKGVNVSAETGDAVNISQSFLSRILDAISF